MVAAATSTKTVKKASVAPLLKKVKKEATIKMKMVKKVASNIASAKLALTKPLVYTAMPPVRQSPPASPVPRPAGPPLHPVSPSPVSPPLPLAGPESPLI